MKHSRKLSTVLVLCWERKCQNQSLTWRNIKPSSGFPGGTAGKEPACQCRRQKRPTWVQSLAWQDPLEEYSYLEDPMDRGAWQATVQRGCKESDTAEHKIQLREKAMDKKLS